MSGCNINRKGKVKMITWLSSWAQGIIVAVVIATIIELILPNGSSKKYIKVVIGIYILFTIISPVIRKVKGNNFDVNEILSAEEYEQKLAQNDNTIWSKFEANNSRTIKDIYISNLTTDIETKLKEKGYGTVSTNIKIKDDENYAIEKISLALYKTKEVVEQNSKDKNVEKVKIEVETIKIEDGSVISAEQRNEDKNRQNNINDSTENNMERNNESILTNSEKQEIKEYLSKTYDIETKNIDIS